VAHFDLSRKDTICALATAPQAAALAVIRVSGPDAEAVRDRVFKPKRGRSPKPFVATLGHVVREQAGALHLVDEALCLTFPEGRSYTGEAGFELSIHGGPTRVRAVLELLRAHGCRMAEPGELTLRAVLTGRMDLCAAEAVHDVVVARSDVAAEAALRNLAGELGLKLDAARAHVVDVLAELEARLDFPDEDLEPMAAARLVATLEMAERDLSRLLDGARLGQRLTDGARVVLYGLPNAGKSTLLNALVGEERALVHDSPGTTRDVLEAETVVAGVPITLVDVAGVREGEVHPVEAMGIARAKDELRRADLVLAVRDLSDPDAHAVDVRELVSTPVVEVGTKVDLVGTDLGGVLAISARDGTGLDTLRACIADALVGDARLGDEAVLTRARQVEEVSAARDSVREAKDALEQGMPGEVVASELRRAGWALDRVLGRELDEEVLDTIFTRFCIGK